MFDKVLHFLILFVENNKVALGLLGLAFIATMRAQLPPPFNGVPLFNWCYEWLVDALKTFMNLRTPAVPPRQEPTKHD